MISFSQVDILKILELGLRESSKSVKDEIASVQALALKKNLNLFDCLISVDRLIELGVANSICVCTELYEFSIDVLIIYYKHRLISSYYKVEQVIPWCLQALSILIGYYQLFEQSHFVNYFNKRIGHAVFMEIIFYSFNKTSSTDQVCIYRLPLMFVLIYFKNEANESLLATHLNSSHIRQIMCDIRKEFELPLRRIISDELLDYRAVTEQITLFHINFPATFILTTIIKHSINIALNPNAALQVHIKKISTILCNENIDIELDKLFPIIDVLFEAPGEIKYLLVSALENMILRVMVFKSEWDYNKLHLKLIADKDTIIALKRNQLDDEAEYERLRHEVASTEAHNVNLKAKVKESQKELKDSKIEKRIFEKLAMKFQRDSEKILKAQSQQAAEIHRAEVRSIRNEAETKSKRLEAENSNLKELLFYSTTFSRGKNYELQGALVYLAFFERL